MFKNIKMRFHNGAAEAKEAKAKKKGKTLYQGLAEAETLYQTTKALTLSGSNFIANAIHFVVLAGAAIGVKYGVDAYTDSGNPKKVFKR